MQAYYLQQLALKKGGTKKQPTSTTAAAATISTTSNNNISVSAVSNPRTRRSVAGTKFTGSSKTTPPPNTTTTPTRSKRITKQAVDSNNNSEEEEEEEEGNIEMSNDDIDDDNEEEEEESQNLRSKRRRVGPPSEPAATAKATALSNNKNTTTATTNDTTGRRRQSRDNRLPSPEYLRAQQWALDTLPSPQTKHSKPVAAATKYQTQSTPPRTSRSRRQGDDSGSSGAAATTTSNVIPLPHHYNSNVNSNANTNNNSMEKPPFGSPMPTRGAATTTSRTTTTASRPRFHVNDNTDRRKLHQPMPSYRRPPATASPNGGFRDNMDNDNDDDEDEDALEIEESAAAAAAMTTTTTGLGDEQQEEFGLLLLQQQRRGGGGVLWVALFGLIVVLALSAVLTLHSLDETTTKTVDWSQSVWNTIANKLSNNRSLSSNVSSSLPSSSFCFSDFPFPVAKIHPSELKLDEYGEALEHQEEEDARLCPSGTESVACPPHGLCMGGELKACSSPHLEVLGAACVWTAQALQYVEALQRELSTRSAAHFCSSSSSSSVAMGGESYDHPLFEYQLLADEIQIPYGPIFIQAFMEDNETNLFVLNQTPEDILMIGLHSNQYVPLPLRCLATKWCRSLVRGFVGLLSTIIGVLFTWFYACFKVHPWMTIFVVLVSAMTLTSIRQVHRRNRERARLETEVLNLRERVYAELSAPGQILQPEMSSVICNRIAWADYPNSRRARDRCTRIIFPFVVKDLESDARVHKSWTMENGDRVLVWQWRDSQPHSVAKANSRDFEKSAALG